MVSVAHIDNVSFAPLGNRRQSRRKGSSPGLKSYFTDEEYIKNSISHRRYHIPVSDLVVSDFNFSSFCCLVAHSFNFLFLLKAILLLLGAFKFEILELVMLSDATFSFPVVHNTNI